MSFCLINLDVASSVQMKIALNAQDLTAFSVLKSVKNAKMAIILMIISTQFTNMERLTTTILNNACQMTH